MRRALSGIKPTNQPHVGNHLGMIMPAIEMQEHYEPFLFVADYHALTTIHDPKAMRQSSYEITAYFLAFGLDIERSTFFRQSDVPEVTELTWVLSCVANMGLLERAHAWKAAKDRGNEGAEPHGLFAYPVLMAADILIYDSDVVPVGKDQIQHIEMTRDMALRFNNIFGETFRIPKGVVKKEVAVIPGLDGRKMSKSYGNTINLMRSKKQLKKQIMSIVTDSAGMTDPKAFEGNHVAQLYAHFATAEELEQMKGYFADPMRFSDTGYGYGHAKVALFNAIERVAAPARERYNALLKHPDELEDILLQGASRARAKAREVLDRTREAVGMRAMGA